MMKNSVEIVRGEPVYAKDFSSLMELSALSLFPSVFGKEFKSVFEKLFKEKRNLFSFEYTHMAKMKDRVVGMILGYDYREKKRDELNTGRLIIKYMGFEFIKRFFLFLKMDRVVGYLNNGEFYISNIAVYPEFRGMGIGSLLINFVEEKVKEKSIKKIVLDVETENKGAIKLYERLGFKKSRKTSIKIGKTDFHFYRMEKIHQTNS